MDPFVTGGAFRVGRGGSWGYDSYNCWSANRSDVGNVPGVTDGSIGFRVVLAPALVPQQTKARREAAVEH
jgi:formylglycine-generating enzyme required for sulfatase activity